MKTLQQHIQEKLLINKDTKPTPPEDLADFFVEEHLSEVPYRYGKGSVSRQFKTKEDFVKLIDDLGIPYKTDTRTRHLAGGIDREETLMILDKEVDARYMGGNIKFDKFVITNCYENHEEPGCWMIWTELETKGYRSSSGFVVSIQDRINWDYEPPKKILNKQDKLKAVKACYTGMSNDKVEWLKELLADTIRTCSGYSY